MGHSGTNPGDAVLLLFHRPTSTGSPGSNSTDKCYNDIPRRRTTSGSCPGPLVYSGMLLARALQRRGRQRVEMVNAPDLIRVRIHSRRIGRLKRIQGNRRLATGTMRAISWWCILAGPVVLPVYTLVKE